MSVTPPFDPDAVTELREAYGLPAPPVRRPAAATGKTSQSAKRRVKSLLKRAAAPFIHQVALRLAGPVRDLVAQRLEPDLVGLQAEVDLTRGELRQLLDAANGVRELAPSFRLISSAEKAVDELHALAVNLELLKGETAVTRSIIDDLGAAIAPGAGIAGVADRFAELREQLNGVARQLRAAPVAGSGPGGDRIEAAPVLLPSFDYVGLERRFRGPSEEIIEKATDRYLDLLRDHQPVLDVGCGRGELLRVVADLGVACSGVDLDAGMVEEAKAAGVDAHLGDAITFLQDQPEHTYGAIVAIQVIEHLPFDVLMELVDAAVTRLQPGGVLMLETPNPQSLFVLGNTFLLDPTHVRPVHPALMVYLCERAGFSDIELRFYSPLTSHYLPLLEEGDEAPPWVATMNQSLTTLNDLLFGPQDYAVIARTPR